MVQGALVSRQVLRSDFVFGTRSMTTELVLGLLVGLDCAHAKQGTLQYTRQGLLSARMGRPQAPDSRTKFSVRAHLQQHQTRVNAALLRIDNPPSFLWALEKDWESI